MSFDKLFDGSAAHLLGANAELIADLRERINPAYADMRGTESYERKLCADALAAADKRIAELEAAIVAWKADQKENMAIAVEECKRANEAERKLAVAREALVWINDQYSSGGAPHAFAAIKAREALARIGGE